MILSSSLYSFGNGGGVFCSCSQIYFKSLRFLYLICCIHIANDTVTCEHFWERSENFQQCSKVFSKFWIIFIFLQSSNGNLAILRRVAGYRQRCSEVFQWYLLIYGRIWAIFKRSNLLSLKGFGWISTTFKIPKVVSLHTHFRNLSLHSF